MQLWVVEPGLRHKADGGLDGFAEAAEHGPKAHRLRCGDGSTRIAHAGRGDHAAFDHHACLYAEEGGAPKHDIGQLARFDRADFMRNSVCDGRVDGVLGDVALDAMIVGAGAVALQRAALRLHLVGSLPGAQYNLADAPHGLRVGTHDREGAQIVQNVFRCDGLTPYAAFGESDVFGDGRIQMVANHQHVQVFVDGVGGEGHGRIGRRRQHIGHSGRPDDVRSVAAARTLGMKRMNAAALERLEGIFHKARFIQGVAVDGHLHIGSVGNGEAGIDGGWRGAPVLVQLKPDGAGADLFQQRFLLAGIAFAQQADIHGKGIQCHQHVLDMPGPRRASGGKGSGGRTRAAPYHGAYAAGQRFVDLLGANKVYVRVDGARRNNHALTSDDFGGRANDDGDPGLYIRIASLAQAGDQAVLDADIGLDDARDGIDDQRIGNDRVGTIGAGALALSHAVADDFSTAELDLFPEDAAVFFDFGEQAGIGKAYAVANAMDYGGAKHFGVGLPGNHHHYSAPMMSPRKPNTRRSPASAMICTVRF